MGLISEEDLRPHLLRLGQEFGIHRHEGFPLGLVGLQETFLRPFQDKSQPVQVVQARARSVLGTAPLSSSNSPGQPAFSGSACTAAFSWACGPRATRLFEAAVGPALPKAVTHVPMGGDPVPAPPTAGVHLGQKPESMPPFPLPRCWRSIHAFSQVTYIQLPPFKKFHYVPHIQHHRHSTSLTEYRNSSAGLALCSFHLGISLGELAQGEFIEQGTNVLAFGLPGTGKTHALCALGHRLVETGYSVLFTPAYRLVQELLAAQRDLQLPRALRKLDNFDFLVLDDLGYLPQGAAESEVLFTLMAERYERRAIGITSNLVFSQWDQIFQNPMATAAAIDRVVHHSVILEFDVPSYRTREAQGRQQNATDNYQQEEKRQK